jgi:hypothetical protein
VRGPHNIIRLIRTGATLERTGAMKVIMDAFDAGPLLRGVAAKAAADDKTTIDVQARQKP